MRSKNRTSLTIVQMNDTHAYFDIHQEMFWQGDHAVYRQAGGYARISTIVNKIRTESLGNCLFCDCGDTMHGTYPALATQGQAMIPIFLKRCLGINVYFKIENSSGLRIQKLFVGNEEIQADQYYSTSFVTMQGVPPKYGRNRKNQSERIIDAMRKYLTKHRPIRAELKGTYLAV